MGKEANIETTYFKQLDGFRFLSITAVVISHFVTTDFVSRFPLGYGVLFFFVLSSFLITRILLTAKKKNEVSNERHLYTLRQFYIRRFIRIFPIYYLLIFVLYLLNWVPVREVIFSLLTYTTNFKLGTGYNAGNFNHLWSLAVEEQFYIFFPFIIFFIDTRHLLKLFILLTLIGGLGRAFFYLQDSVIIPYSNFHTISCLDSLGIGSILAYMSLYSQNKLKKIIGNKWLFSISILLFFVLMIASYSLMDVKNRVNFVSIIILRFEFNLMSFWLLGWAITFGYKGFLKKALEWGPVIYLGRISYGIYLYHLFVPQLVNIVFKHFRIGLMDEYGSESPLLVTIYILVTIIIASASWFIIEKPINSFKKYYNYFKKTDQASYVTQMGNIKSD